MRRKGGTIPLGHYMHVCSGSIHFKLPEGGEEGRRLDQLNPLPVINYPPRQTSEPTYACEQCLRMNCSPEGDGTRERGGDN